MGLRAGGAGAQQSPAGRSRGSPSRTRWCGSCWPSSSIAPWRVGQSSVSSRLMPMRCRRPVLCLASVSPRRRELLAQIGVPHTVVGAHIDETVMPDGERARIRHAHGAREGAGGSRQGEKLPVLAADTTVVLDEVIYGKPADRADGLAMLGRLSGRTHEVLTAVALADARASLRCSVSASAVRFRAAHRRRVRGLLGDRGAARQGGRLRDPGARRRVHRVAERELLRRDGAAAVRDRGAVARRRRTVLGTERRGERSRSWSTSRRARPAPRIVENGVLQEIYVERTSRRGLVSNLYKGRVSRVLPGHAGGLRRHRSGAHGISARGRHRQTHRPMTTVVVLPRRCPPVRTSGGW